MRAIVFDGDGHVAVEDRPEPRIVAADDAIVRVTTAGICGSDLHIVEGRDTGVRAGTIMGHELVGVVEELGSEHSWLTVGARVVAPFSVNCGRCFYCRRSLPARCASSMCFGVVDEGGHGLEGAQAQYLRVPMAPSTLMKLPDRRADGQPFRDEDAIFLGDVLSTAYSATEATGIQFGDVVAVIGCGPVGLLAILSALLLGAREVVAVDVVDYRLEKAHRLGATPVHRHSGQLVPLLAQMTEGRGADAVVEAVGNPAALDMAIRAARPGAVVSIAGYHTEEQYPLPIKVAYQKNLTIRTGRCSARTYMPKLLPLVVEGKVPLHELVSHVLLLEDGVRGYEIFARRDDAAIKVLLKP